MQNIILDMYKRAHLCNQPFDDLEAILGTLNALRRALIRRAVRIQRMHAMRLHTPKPDGIPDADAEKFSTLISMDNVGNYKLTPILPRLIAKYETALTERKAAQARAAAKRPAHRRAKRPRLA